MRNLRGGKKERVKGVIDLFCGEFTLNDLELSCPGVSLHTIRKVLYGLKKDGKITCRGWGSGAKWCKKGEYD
ncbi:MAG: hypothetical protein SVY10_11975 [Thermodesulfobacteriota bacterium]|nr:hypothetical protein [Thermodesulfobacteriota bacterium]